MTSHSISTLPLLSSFFFFLKDTAPPEIYPLPLHAPLPISRDEWLHWRAELALLVGDTKTAASRAAQMHDPGAHGSLLARVLAAEGKRDASRAALDLLRSEEHTSELQSQSNLVCRLLLEKKK